MAARSKAWVCGRSPTGIAGLNRTGTSVSCECCVVGLSEVSATDRSFVQRSPTECSVSECNLETFTVRRVFAFLFSNVGGLHS